MGRVLDDKEVIGMNNIAKRLLGACLLPVVAVGVLSGCVGGGAPEGKEVTVKSETAKKEPVAQPKKAAAPGGLLAPGGEVQGSAASLPWVSFDGSESVWSHQVTGIENAPAADIALIAESEATITDYDVYYIAVQSSYVSGTVTPHSSFYTEFDGVRADGTKLDELMLIGLDACPSTSVGGAPEDPAVSLVNCVAVAVPKGSEKPAGVAWAQYDTEYASYGGSPARILL